MRRSALLLAAIGSLACAARPGAAGRCRHVDRGLWGGIFVIADLVCTKGCETVHRFDLVQSVDGTAVPTLAAFERTALFDGRPHVVVLRPNNESCAREVTVVARTRASTPPAVAAKDLDAAPGWARRRMFAHAIPEMALASIDGATIDGRGLLGKKHVLVLWDRADRGEEANAVTMMQVLQKAQSDLLERGVHVVFAQVQPPGSSRTPMTSDELRAWSQEWTLAEFPMIPLYRQPSSGEHDPSREVGVEDGYRLFAQLGQSPTIVLLDARGVVRWHSEGVQPPDPSEPVQDPAQYSIIEAVRFALDRL